MDSEHGERILICRSTSPRSEDFQYCPWNRHEQSATASVLAKRYTAATGSSARTAPLLLLDHRPSAIMFDRSPSQVSLARPLASDTIH